MIHPYEPEPSQRITDDYDDTDDRVDDLRMLEYELNIAHEWEQQQEKSK